MRIFWYVRRVWLLRNLENLPVSRQTDLMNSVRRWTRLEMDNLIQLYEQHPLWSYEDIACQLLLTCPDSSAASLWTQPWSAKECAHRLYMLYALTPERFGSGLLPPLFNHSEVDYTPETAEMDPIITRAQPTFCKECAALNLGETHVEAMMDFDDFWAGPDPAGHPANQSLHSLKRSSEYCCCCDFMYNTAIRTIHPLKSEQPIKAEADNLQTRLSFARYHGAHFLEILTAARPLQILARLQMAHCEISKVSS
jgi:hypothetical protein